MHFAVIIKNKIKTNAMVVTSIELLVTENVVKKANDLLLSPTKSKNGLVKF